MSTSYFAADSEEKLIDHLENLLVNWGYRTSGVSMYGSVFQAYWRNIAAYYSPIISAQDWTTSLSFAGEQGELVIMAIPIARQLVNQYATLVTKPRIHWECVTDVAASKPIETSRLGKGILNDVSERFNFDKKKYKIAEKMAVVGADFISVTWRIDKGLPYTGEAQKPEQLPPNTGMVPGQIPTGDNEDPNIPRPEMDGMVAPGIEATPETTLMLGDVHVERHDVHDTIYDWTIEEEENRDWIMIRRKVNRWNIAAVHPELASFIAALPSAQDELSENPQLQFITQFDTQDDIFIREFYHRPTAALPKGRMLIYASKNVILSPEGIVPNTYGCLPVVSFMQYTLNQTSLGYPWLSDLLPCQEMFDTCMSAIATNNAATAVQNVITPKGSNISVRQIGGMNFIQYEVRENGQALKPEGLNLTQSAPETFKFGDQLNGLMGSLSNLNSTLRGDPPPNVTSGAMAATLSANAMELLSNAQKVILEGFERVADLVILCFNRFATEKQVINIVGEGNVAYVKEFLGSDLADIRKIKGRMDNPLLSSTAGRMSLTESIMPLLAAGNEEMAGKVMTVLSGGPVETVFKGRFSEEMAIMMETDALLEGRSVMPYITDYQPGYIRAYKELLYNPEVRINSQLAMQIQQLIVERTKLWQMLPPDQKEMLFGIAQAQVGMPPPAMMPAGPPAEASLKEPEGAAGALPASPALPG